ncbi:CgeB family protein [Nitrosophilus labii]|uniref:CgeB family protein n=1 Tax=Nitrosophilus labii TaxID=2706014 RepID=UPI001656CA5A|nr:glycosyltransferase [Nitrosophilus labii]
MLKIALISDDLTRISLLLENNISIYNITSLNYRFILKFCKIDLFFVESSWNGYKNRWKYKIASYPDVPSRNNNKLKKIVEYAKDLNIPTVFWNKEDSVHFDRFIDSAVLFDYIFTVDINAVEKYKRIVNIPVNVLMFAIQPKIHDLTGFNFKYKKANFVGSYSRHIHTRRREWQNMFFETLCENGFEVDVYNRNSDRNPKIYGYPKLSCINEEKKVKYKKTAQIYKDYLISLNVNTITDSETMFSRRLIEILACGGVCVTNPSLAVDKMFKDYCYVVNSKEEFREILVRLKKDGLSKNDYERIRAGAEYVLKNHTWKRRIEYICEVIGVK